MSPEEVLGLADDIYREDVVFRDPRNAFRGLKNYKTIFWSLRFHGRLFFKVLYVDVQRLWQPDDQQIKYGPPALDLQLRLNPSSAHPQHLQEQHIRTMRRMQFTGRHGGTTKGATRLPRQL